MVAEPSADPTESAEIDERSVLARAARLLDAFDSTGDWVGLAELIARTGLPKSTVHRLAEKLSALGWLERGHLGYRVGIRLFEIGGRAGRHRQLRESARPHLQWVGVQSGLSVMLGVLDSADVLILEQLNARGSDLPHSRGGRQPAYCTAIGKVLAAFGSREEVDSILDAPMPPRTQWTAVTAPAFFHELQKVNMSGYGLEREEAYLEIASIAVPLRGSGRAVAGIALVGPVDTVQLDLHLPLLARAATMIWSDMLASRRTHGQIL